MKSFLIENVRNFATDYEKKLLTDSELIAKYSKYIEPEDLRHLDFSLSMDGSGSAGSFYKSVYLDKYYKLSLLLGNGMFGYEAINEVLASRIAELLGFDCVVYDLVYATVKIDSKEYTTWLCVSDNYKLPGDNRTTLEFQMKRTGISDAYVCCSNLGLKSQINSMLLLDYIIDNRDRHAANIEILYNNGNLRLAPIFDCGSSLLAPQQYNMELIKNFDYMHNGPVNNCLISVYWNDVLCKLKNQITVPFIDLDELFISDLKYAVDEYIVDKELDMIKCRYDYARRTLNG